MATGTGKTTVMAMLIAWHILNKVTYPDDPRFSKNVFILTPNLTIKNRLQVLFPDSPNNYYAEFDVVPYDLKDKLRQGKVRVIPKDWNDDETKRRIALTLNLSKIINHIYRHIRKENTLSLTPIYNTERQIIYTGDMAPWYTSRPHSPTVKSHINYAVYDSGWETTEAYMLDRDPNVESWVKNEHLGFDIHYVHNGIHHKYRPDYFIRLINGTHLVLEVKGKVTQQVRSKELAMQEWIQAINQDGRFGKWHYAMSTNPKDLEGLIKNALNN